jgi:hypothetical protein
LNVLYARPRFGAGRGVIGRAALSVAVSAALLTGLAGATPASASTEYSCSDLSGAGSFSDPLQIGVVEGDVVISDCAPLTSGEGYDVEYFSFTLDSPAPEVSYVASRFTLTSDAISAVNPRLATSGGYTLLHSSSGVWLGDEPNFTGRLQYLSPLGGNGGDLNAGTYVLGMEKIDSPLRSLTTPSYNIVFHIA